MKRYKIARHEVIAAGLHMDANPARQACGIETLDRPRLEDDTATVLRQRLDLDDAALDAHGTDLPLQHRCRHPPCLELR